MSGRFWVLFLAGLAVVGAAVWGILFSTRGSHLELTGSVLKVRTLADGSGTLVFADFRLTNPSALPFVVNSVAMSLDTSADEVAQARMLSKADVDAVSRYYKLLGPKYNDVLSVLDKIPPGETVDRMAAGRFDAPLAVVDSRKTLRLRIEEVDAAVAEISEQR